MSGLQSYRSIQHYLNTTDSTSSTTGSIVLDGGLGLNKNLYVGGTLYSNSFNLSLTDGSTSVTTGALVVNGGIGIGENLHLGGLMRIHNTTQSTTSITGALVVTGGVGISGSLYHNGLYSSDANGVYTEGRYGNMAFKSASGASSVWAISASDGTTTLFGVSNVGTNVGTRIYSTFESSGSSTGALVVSGGVGIAKNANIGGIAKISNTTVATSSSTGALIVAGGIGCSNRIQFPNDSEKKKVVLYDSGNDFQYFGFGMQSSELRYQISSPTVHHSFYAGTGTTTDQELMRIEGNLGIAQGVKIYHTTESTSSTTGALVVNGGIGIGGSGFVQSNLKMNSSTSRITFTSDATKRRLVLYDVFDNDYQWFGFGIRSSELRYQVSGTTAHHSFYAGTGTTTDQELMRIDGNLGIAQGVKIYHTTETTSSSTGALVVTGGVGIAKDMVIGGTITIQDTTISSSNLTGSLIVSGGIGCGDKIQFPSADVKKRVVFHDSGNNYQFYGIGMQSYELRYQVGLVSGHHSFYAGTGTASEQELMRIDGDLGKAQGVKIYHSTASTSITTGALVVTGGVGISGELYHDGLYSTHSYGTYLEGTYGNIHFKTAAIASSNWNIKASDGTTMLFGVYNGYATGGTQVFSTIESTGTAIGALVVSGGVGIAKDVYIGGEMRIVVTTQATSISTGSAIISGGVGIAKDVYIGGALRVIITTEATSISTGSSIISGGVGIAKDVFIGGEANIIVTTQSTSSSTGSLIALGGAGIAKDVFIGGTTKILITTDTVSETAGAFQVRGGVGVAKNIYAVGGFWMPGGFGSQIRFTPGTSPVSAKMIIGDGTGWCLQVTNVAGSAGVNIYDNGNLHVSGTLTKGGGSFQIEHPDPSKAGWKLRHCFVESPTRGDNIYRYLITTTNGEYTIQLPTYYKYLNENTQIMITPSNGFGSGYGKLDELEENINIKVNMDGEYNVLIIGTRKDQMMRDYWDKDEAEIPPS